MHSLAALAAEKEVTPFLDFQGAVFSVTTAMYPHSGQES